MPGIGPQGRERLAQRDRVLEKSLCFMELLCGCIQNVAL